MTVPTIPSIASEAGGATIAAATPSVCPGVAGGDWTMSLLFVPDQENPGSLIENWDGSDTGWRISMDGSAGDGSAALTCLFGGGGGPPSNTTVTTAAMTGLVGKIVHLLIGVSDTTVTMHVNGNLAENGSLANPYAARVAGANPLITQDIHMIGFGYVGGSDFSLLAPSFYRQLVTTGGKFNNLLTPLDAIRLSVPAVSNVYTNAWDGYSALESGPFSAGIPTEGLKPALTSWQPQPGAGTDVLTADDPADLPFFVPQANDWYQSSAAVAA